MNNKVLYVEIKKHGTNGINGHVFLIAAVLIRFLIEDFPVTFLSLSGMAPGG